MGIEHKFLCSFLIDMSVLTLQTTEWKKGAMTISIASQYFWIYMLKWGCTFRLKRLEGVIQKGITVD